MNKAEKLLGIHTIGFVIGLVTYITTVINTVFVALSYLKGKDKE